MQPNGDVVACTSSTTIGNVRERGVRSILASEPFARNADAGPSCSVGCRDWGIYDLSALYERRFTLDDGRRYARAFADRRGRSRTAGAS